MAALLGAAVIVPAAAFAGAPMGGQDHGWHNQNNGGGHNNGGSHNNNGGGRSQQADRPQYRAAPQGRPSGGQRSGQWTIPSQGRPQQFQDQARDDHGQPGQQWNRGDRGQPGQPFDRGDRSQAAQQWNRDGHNDRGQRWNRGNGRPGWNTGNRAGWNNRGGNWNRDWRHDDRYDWNHYRYSNRNLFHLPRYRAPYGWGYGYRPFGIGSILDDVFFAESYWIDDPYEYRLPEAYGPYRWVRYYNDALLVDIETGEVVDEVDDIFW